MRIWKGLFYCYWMSDKPLGQEQRISPGRAYAHLEGTLLLLLDERQTFGPGGVGGEHLQHGRQLSDQPGR